MSALRCAVAWIHSWCEPRNLGSVAPLSKAGRRSRGSVETLPSGSIRVKVYAGIDPVSKKRHYLDEVIPAGPKAAKEAEKARTRLLAQVDERRNPRTRATVDQMLDRYLSVLDVEQTTRSTYEGYIRNHIRPVLGAVPLARLDAETIESFYAQLRTCRARCGGRRPIEHRTAREHTCDDRCRRHECTPLSASAVRQIHAILSSACKRAVRWNWISTNPLETAEPPPAARPNPRPPTAEQAARICTAAWRDPDWGMLVWLAMMTGARRGELCALAWDRLDFAAGILWIRPGRRPHLGERHQEPPAAPNRARRPDPRPPPAVPRSLPSPRRRSRPRTRRRRSDVLARSRRAELATAGFGQPAVRADVPEAGLGHEHPPAAPLLGD